MTEALAARALAVALAALRLAPTLTLVPLFGGRALSLPLRLAVALTAALALTAAPAVNVPTGLALWVVASRELTVGVALALCLAAPFFALRQAGALLDANPRDGDGPVATLYEGAAAATLLGAGAHRAILRALADSWELLPAGAVDAWETSRLVELSARWTARALAAGVALAGAGMLAALTVELLRAATRRLAGVGLDDGGVEGLARLAVAALGLGVATGAARELMASVVAALGPG
ncbi:MAG: flagellar biosynthetic protein FliR [Polyangiales bacterium]